MTSHLKSANANRKSHFRDIEKALKTHWAAYKKSNGIGDET